MSLPLLTIVAGSLALALSAQVASAAEAPVIHWKIEGVPLGSDLLDEPPTDMLGGTFDVALIDGTPTLVRASIGAFDFHVSMPNDRNEVSAQLTPDSLVLTNSRDVCGDKPYIDCETGTSLVMTFAGNVGESRSRVAVTGGTFYYYQSHYFYGWGTLRPNGFVVQVPEPATALLWPLGLLGLAVATRRTKRRT